jgi:hypothetical protein
VRQPVPQVPADRDRNHLPRNRKPANTEDEPGDAIPPVSRQSRSANATLPPGRDRGHRGEPQLGGVGGDAGF